MWSSSIGPSRVRSLVAAAVAIAVLAAAPAGAEAAGKQGKHAEMIALARQIAALKADPAQAARVSRLRDRYRRLSDSLGGDDPGALVGAGSAPRAWSRGNSVVPPNCAASVDIVESEDTPIGIPDGPGGMAMSTITVSGVGTYLQDLDLFTDLPHTFAAELDITVTSPAGTEMTLTTDNGAGNDNVFAGTTWDDDAGDTNPPGPVTDNVYADLVLETPLAPEEALAAFIGEDPNGDWTITIVDDAGDTNPPGPVTDNLFADLVLETPLVPEEALSAFVGEDPNGTWTLTIVDDAGEDVGTL